MMTLSALNQFLKQHTTEETQRLNGVKKDYSQFPVARGKFDTPCYRFDTNLEDLRSLFLSKKVLLPLRHVSRRAYTRNGMSHSLYCLPVY